MQLGDGKVYNWKYVETRRTNKQTGKQTYSLKIWLCNGNKALRESDINSAFHFEMDKKAEGVEFENSINDFIQEQSEKCSSVDPENFKDYIPKMSYQEFNKWKAKDKDEQLTIDV